jgi:hypothetical protein
MKPLWKEVLAFLSSLGICVWPEMRDIPVLSVAFPALNERSSYSTHSGGGATTRGLCLTEYSSSGFSLPTLSFSNGRYQVTNQTISTSKSAQVTAILCLSGLPRDLTLSILAHESVHAWLKLHPSFLASPRAQAMDKQAEEGVCQLVAHLFLQRLERGSSPPPAHTSSGPSDDIPDSKLLKFFKYSIEAETSPIYGDGFRKAAQLYSALGLEPLLLHLLETGSFPT